MLPPGVTAITTIKLCPEADQQITAEHMDTGSSSGNDNETEAALKRRRDQHIVRAQRRDIAEQQPHLQKKKIMKQLKNVPIAKANTSLPAAIKQNTDSDMQNSDMQNTQIEHEETQQQPQEELDQKKRLKELAVIDLEVDEDEYNDMLRYGRDYDAIKARQQVYIWR